AIITNSVVRMRSLPESPKRGGPCAAAGIMSIALPAYRASAAHNPRIRCAPHAPESQREISRGCAMSSIAQGWMRQQDTDPHTNIANQTQGEIWAPSLK